MDPVMQEPGSSVEMIHAPDPPPLQAPFQPSSTPVSLERRFMVWNDVGIVRCYNTEEENSIEVEFHDANVLRQLHLNNAGNHTLAALSTEALLLASPKLDGSASKLECWHFDAWDDNTEWSVEIPEDEEIVVIALGDRFAACITDKNYIRLYSLSLVQCEVFLLPGPAVSCTARGDHLLIAYHKGLGVDGTPSLNLMIVKVALGGHCVIKEFSLPLSSKAFLNWIGCTDEGNPCVVDSCGAVFILMLSCGTKWIPIANTSAQLKRESESYFIVGLSEIKQEIRCILCKGARYPTLLPRPEVTTLPFSLPFCEMSTDKGRLEEENRRYAMAHQSMELQLGGGLDVDPDFRPIEKKWADVLLKMFALSTRENRLNRAFEIARMMPNAALIQGAIRYATRSHRLDLAERLSDFLNQTLSKNVEEDNSD